MKNTYVVSDNKLYSELPTLDSTVIDRERERETERERQRERFGLGNSMAVLEFGVVTASSTVFSRNSTPYAYASTTRPFRFKRSARTIQCVQTTQTSPSRTQRIMENIAVSSEVGGAGGAYSYNALKRLDQLWTNICSQADKPEPQKIVSIISGLFRDSDLASKKVDTFDVIVCGGTLGIFIAAALSSKGLRVGIVERNILKGREQEWNISKKELLELVEVGILAEEDVDEAVGVKFNPNRCGFEERGEIWVEDILNCGISPEKLIETMKKRFKLLGGEIFEGCNVSSLSIYDDAAVLQTAEEEVLSSRLIIDAMGNFSPIVRQIRSGRKPDGVCLVVGSCARGFQDNSTSDVIYSSSSVEQIGNSKVQLFWEAFPAGSGPKDRTTYMFTYVDPQPYCPKLEELLEEYWDLMPKYQAVSLDELEILRIVYGIFPTYRGSPLPAAFSRVLQFGDASGVQSPVSFGGFGSLTRHLGRLSDGIYEAIVGDFLDSESLSLLNPYMPNLSASWLFQKAMSAKQESNIPSHFINDLLYVNFQSMQRLGDPVLRPFLQDVIQFWPLTKTLSLVMLTKPQLLPFIFKQATFFALSLMHAHRHRHMHAHTHSGLLLLYLGLKHKLEKNSLLLCYAAFACAANITEYI